MKKLISILLASMMLAGAAPAVISGETPASLAVDSASPAEIKDDTILLDESISAAELLSYFEDKSALTVTSGDGTQLVLADKVSSGATVSAGDKSLKVAIYGDANSDGKLNARDIISIMRGMMDEGYSAVEDLNADGAVNVKDVIKLMRKLVGHNEQLGDNCARAAEGSDKVSLYFDSLMHRIGRSNTTVYGTTTGLIRMAKNELEDAMMMIVTRERFDDVSVEITPMTNSKGDTVEAQLYDMYAFDQTLFKQLVISNIQAQENQEGDYFAEPLPRLVGTLNLGENESHGVMIQVKTTADTAPGYYSADVIVKDKDGAELKRTVLRTLVWDVTLDDDTASDTAFGVDWNGPTFRKYKGDMKVINTPEVIAETYETSLRYMDFLMDNRISPYSLPVDVKSAEADKYMDNPRVTSFCVDGGGQFRGESQRSDSEIIAIYNKLQTKPEWLHKAYVYLVDEPSMYHTHESKMVYDRMTSLFEKTYGEVIEWHQVTPMGGNDPYKYPYDDNGGYYTDTNEYTYQYADIMCPQTYAFTRYYTNQEKKDAKKAGIILFPPGSYENRWTNDEVWSMFGEQFQQRYDKWAEKGNRRWWYICCSPMLPHANFFRYYQGAAQRVVLWQQYLFHSEGLLYWHMQYDWDRIKLNDMGVNDGDGLLIYWGDLFGLSTNEPVSSVRLEYIRDGIEDFQYMKQIEEKLAGGRDEVLKTYVNKVTTAILDYSEDYHDIENVRTDLGFALENASKGE